MADPILGLEESAEKRAIMFMDRRVTVLETTLRNYGRTLVVIGSLGTTLLAAILGVVWMRG